MWINGDEMKRILIVEDDGALANGLCRALSSDLNIVQACNTLKLARTVFAENQFDLVILDVNLPDGNGFDFLQEIKAQSETRVIMLTANDMETDIVSGLEQGAEDYITKPFSLAVLRARVNTQLRRPQNRESQAVVSIGDYKFDFDNMEFLVNGVNIELSKTEQKLLRILIDNRGITLSRATLIDRIWTDGAEYVDENALSVTVKRLRTKLGVDDYIKTVYGVGYMWAKKEE